MPGKLSYFPVSGRAEPIRALCWLAKHEFEDHHVDPMSWATEKINYPLESMPIWEEDGITYCQSAAILRMLGIRFGYYSTDPQTMWEIDSLLDLIEENMDAAWVPARTAIMQQESSEEERNNWAGFFDKILPILEGRLAQHPGKSYIAGTDRLTIADLKIYSCFIAIFEI